MVLILDLSVTNHQPPFPALGILKKFLDEGHGQAEIHYNFKEGRHSVVNRPISLLSKIVSSTDTIPPQGLLFDPLIVNDFLQQEDIERLDAELAGAGGGGHASQQEVGQGQVDQGQVDQGQVYQGQVDQGQVDQCQVDQDQVDQGTTDGQPRELEEQASSLSLPPPSSSSSSSSSLPPTRRTNRTRKQRNKFN